IRANRCKYSRKRSSWADGSELTRLMRLPPNDKDAVWVATNHLRRSFSQESCSREGRFFDLVPEIVTTGNQRTNPHPHEITTSRQGVTSLPKSSLIFEPRMRYTSMGCG